MNTKNKRTINKKILNKKTRKKKENESDIDKLKNFLLMLKTDISSKCKIGKTCVAPPESRSGQKILICKKNVFKAPPNQQGDYINRIEKSGQKSIKLDIFNMNLLAQSVIKTLDKSIRNNVEHYDKICKLNDQYVLESKKIGYKIGKRTYNSLENYLRNIPNIDIDLVCKWLEQICKILDILYEKIQFHHCDTKVAQIFLDKDGKAILGDLDKVTFTLIINKKAYRIHLTHLPYSSILQNIVSDHHIPEHLHLLSKIEVMRFENNPRISPDLEKASFIASAALLSRNEENATKIIDKTKSLYQGFKIMLPSNLDSVYRATSHKASVRYIQILKPPKYVYQLTSDVKTYYR